jgi:integrase
MLRLLFYTAVHVSEVASIRIEDIDLEGCKIFIDQGKGAKDGSVANRNFSHMDDRTISLKGP